MADKIGDYSIRSGSTALQFWPLATGSTVAGATPPALTPPVAPGTPNPIVVPPQFAIFDVLIRRSEDAVITSTVAAPVLLTQVTATPTVNTMPLIREADGSSRICFAVPPNSGTNFEGTLRLVVRRGTSGSGTSTTLDISIKAAQGTLTDKLVVFFVVHANPPQRHAWVKLKVVDHATPATVISGASVELNVLRDNLTYREINRRLAFTSGGDGFIADGTRNVIGLQLDWPLIFKATATGRTARGHLIKLAVANAHDNTASFEPDPLPMMTNASASLATKRVLLDPGHGVVYALTTSRRSQEWYAAHKVADRIAEILRTEHSMPAANILFTRTAGFGLIEPTSMTSNGAPETGDGRYEFDLPNKRIRVRLASLGLLDISNLVLTTHSGAAHTAQPVPDADRTRLLTVNAAALTTITTRIDGTLASSSRRVQPGSIRWDAASGSYMYTREPIPPGTGASTDHAFPINTTDWFTVDSAMIRVLAERSARWSVANEIGSSGTTTSSGTSFTDAARAALIADGAIDYMRDKIVGYSDVTAPNGWLNGGIKAWGPSARLNYMNANAADLYLTLHENAGGGKGGMTLFSVLGGADAPPDDQVRIGKIFAKYLDWFDLGLRQGGLTQEMTTNPAAMLHAGNNNRDKYAYFESEFMDGLNPANSNQFRWEQMIETANVDRLARQIVAGVVEILLGRQSLDSLTHNGTFTLW